MSESFHHPKGKPTARDVTSWLHIHASNLGVSESPTCSLAKIEKYFAERAAQRKVSAAEAKRLANEFWAWYRAACWLPEYFGDVVVVNLKHRRDRLRQFKAGLPKDWPFHAPQTIAAVDGKKCQPPTWWGGRGGGAWGCYRSHLQLIEQALNQGSQSLLIFEDDAIFCEDFAAKCERFLRAVPDDWGMLYLGGQHLNVGQRPPTKINADVWRPWNVNRTHAFAIHRRALPTVYKHLVRQDWTKGHHIDHHLGRLHNSGAVPVYCPREWLVGQGGGHSNVAGKTKPEKFWQPAATAAVDPSAVPFVAVLGLHSSGSSAIAGLLWHLGVHLGNDLVGYYGDQPGAACGYEARGLMEICEAAAPFPGSEYRLKRGEIWNRLGPWIDGRRREAAQKNAIAGGKYPQLCRLGDQLRNLLGEQLQVVNCERPIDESIDSMVRRTGKPREVIAAHQRWLEKGRRDLLGQLPAERVLSLDYAAVLADPKLAVAQLCDFLGLTPSTAAVNKAAASIDPAKRHIGGAA